MVWSKQRQAKHLRINSHSLTSAPNAFAFIAATIDIIYENGNNFFFFVSLKIIRRKKTATTNTTRDPKRMVSNTMIKIKEFICVFFSPHSVRNCFVFVFCFCNETHQNEQESFELNAQNSQLCYAGKSYGIFSLYT